MAHAQEEQQKEHYDRIQDSYEAHYDDEFSQMYRRRFLYEPMFRGVELSGRHVLEAMSGSGQVTGFLRERGARVTALDISEQAIESFRRRWPGCDAKQGSVFDSGFENGSFDCVVVLGGLHHVHPRLNVAVEEFARLLKPGGYLCFGEPHAGSLPDIVRRWWYQRDDLFEDGEEAIDITALERDHGTSFEFEWSRYMGSAAYLLVLNSMVFRVPLRSKRFYSPILFKLESLLQPMQGRRMSCFALARWRRR